MFYALVQAFVELVFARSWSFSLLILAFLSFFYSYFCTFLDSCISDSVFISDLFIWFNAWILLCDIAVIVDLFWFKFITCSGYFILSAYAWGIFFMYICCRLSSRLRFHVFWKVRRDTCSALEKNNTYSKNKCNTRDIELVTIKLSHNYYRNN